MPHNTGIWYSHCDICETLVGQLMDKNANVLNNNGVMFYIFKNTVTMVFHSFLKSFTQFLVSFCLLPLHSLISY